MTVTARLILRNNLLFRHLDDRTLDRLATLAVRRSYPRGATLFAQGDPGDALYAVITGQVRIGTLAPDGREIFLNIMESGDTFGEIAVIDGQPRTAGAMAATDTEVFMVRRSDFTALLAEEPALAGHLLRLFCQRLRWTSDLIEESALQNVESRLARRVLRLAADHGTTSGGQTVLQISQGELANFLSVSRQIVNQYLQEWRRQGWIEVARGRLILLDPAALSRLAGALVRSVTPG